MAQGRRSDLQQNRREGDSNRLRQKGDHADLLSLLPLPLPLPNDPLQLRRPIPAEGGRDLLPQIVDPVSLLPSLLHGADLGGTVQDRHRGASGEASGAGERGREAVTEVRGGAEEERDGIRFVEGGGCAEKSEEYENGR
ncbi:unnamed protein product [Cuscuta epithymum]|uniref:Uncharacterized protein n=1 Tax=Cuscuta epithymum TaxID=186058 RepID=A0AAV0C915_9ASTE|nr:unnamed protein product [Cuscuta epithymum]